MTVAELAGVPGARAWRARVHRARRAHRQRSLSDTLTDLYTVLWLVVVYGYALLTTVQQHLRVPAAPPDLMTQRQWIAAAVLLAGAGLVWRGLRALGPLLASPAEQAWGVATPIDRRGWLLPRFVALLLGGAVAGAVTVPVVTVLGLRGGYLGAAALPGAAFGIAGVALCVAAQTVPSARWPRIVGTTLVSVGAAAAAFTVIAHRMGHVPALPAGAIGRGLTVVGPALAVVSVVLAVPALARLDFAALGARAEVATAAVASAVWLDPSLLRRVLEVQRWRRVGRVRSLPLVRVLPGRWSALLQVEARRLVRRPGALLMWGALVLAQYAAALVVPSVVGVSHLIGAYVAAGRLTSGLRAVVGSNELRRSLGGDERVLRLVHLVVPTLGAALWWVITAPAGGPRVGVGALLLLAGIVAAAYRSATRPARSYDEMVIDTPFGFIPLGLLIQLVRGPDLLGAVIVLQLLLG